MRPRPEAMSKIDLQNRTFTGKKLKVLNALVEGKGKEDAATLAGVSSRTVRRWLEDDGEFAAALRQASGEQLKEAGRRLAAKTDWAIGELVKLIEDKDSSGIIKLRAIGLILDHAPKYVDMSDMIERIEQLERDFYERKP